MPGLWCLPRWIETWNGTGYTALVIRSFRHRGLKRLYANGDARGVPSAFLRRLRLILADLDAAQVASDLGLPG
jgi:plasmid maintenance system killer protein